MYFCKIQSQEEVNNVGVNVGVGGIFINSLVSFMSAFLCFAVRLASFFLGKKYWTKSFNTG